MTTFTRSVVLSTIGASLFGNSLTKEERDAGWLKRFNDATNLNETDMPAEVLGKLQELRTRIQANLSQGNMAAIRRQSAELNGLYGFYEDQLAHGKPDMHFLIATDTYQGRLAAELVQGHLHHCGLNADIHVPRELSTRNTTAFSNGMRDLIAWCEDILPGYQQNGYQVVFNLVAGFKSLQGYLNIIGMFYADRLIYIFDAPTADLISIPKLPIRLDLDQIRRYAAHLAMLDAEIEPLPLDAFSHLPEMFIEHVQDGAAVKVILSTWGRLVWSRAKAEVLAEALLHFPRLDYTDLFRKTAEALPKHERAALQERLGRVAAHLMARQGDPASMKTDSMLQYDNYVNKAGQDGVPIGHFRANNQGYRVSCESRSGTLVLRKYGPHAINDKP